MIYFQPFKVMIHGSSDGSDYRRELADVITPSSAELHFEKTEGKYTHIIYKIINYASLNCMPLSFTEKVFRTEKRIAIYAC